MTWKIDDAMPIWMQLADQIKMRIITGQYPCGSKLPSVRDLAATASVNPNTMQRALAKLDDQGLTETNRTAGRIVTTSEERIAQIRRDMAETQIGRYYEEMKRLGYSAEEAAEMVRVKNMIRGEE